MKDMDTKFREQLSKRYPEELEKAFGIQRGPLDFEDLKKRDIVLFGAGQNGAAALKAFEKHGVSVRCFCDNNPGKQGTELCGVKILSPEQAVEQFPEASFFITTPQFSLITHQLERIGRPGGGSLRGQKGHIHDCCELFLTLSEEDIDAYFYGDKTRTNFYYYGEIFEREINGLYNIVDSGKVILPIVNIVLTERCTLRCRDCSIWIPYRERPSDRNCEEIISTMADLAGAVDSIERLSLVGGEPFLYKNLDRVVSVLVGHKNIKSITITTNGTVVPCSKVLDILEREKTIEVYISDYGSQSKNKKELTDIFSMRGINFRVNQFEWIRFPKIKLYDRTREELESNYIQCMKRGSCSNLNLGRFYPCYFASQAEELGLIPISESNSINLLRMENPSELKSKFRNFVKDTKYIDACRYCYFDGRSQMEYLEIVPPAIQAEGPLSIEDLVVRE